MSQITYEASVYTRTVKYKNFKGEVNDTTLYFALDPIEQILQAGALQWQGVAAPSSRTRWSAKVARNSPWS